MEIRKDDHIIGTWFAEAPNGDDWLLTVLRRGEKYLGEYRFRYTRDGKIFDSKDKKSFYSLELSAARYSEETVIEKLNRLFEIIKTRYSKFHKFIKVCGSFDRWRYLMAQEDFAHIKREEIK